MAKFFDIMPPKPKPALKPSEPRKNGCGWFVFGLMILITLAIYINMPQKEGSNINQPAEAQSPAANNFQPFSDSWSFSLTPEKDLIVRILNAAGENTSAEKAKKILSDAGYKIEQIGLSSNLYEQTIVYYKKGQLSQGQKIETILKNHFQTKLQESESLGATYDLLVIVGQK